MNFGQWQWVDIVFVEVKRKQFLRMCSPAQAKYLWQSSETSTTIVKLKIFFPEILVLHKSLISGLFESKALQKPKSQWCIHNIWIHKKKVYVYFGYTVYTRNFLNYHHLLLLNCFLIFLTSSLKYKKINEDS